MILHRGIVQSPVSSRRAGSLFLAALLGAALGCAPPPTHKVYPDAGNGPGTGGTGTGGSGGSGGVSSGETGGSGGSFTAPDASVSTGGSGGSGSQDAGAMPPAADASAGNDGPTLATVSLNILSNCVFCHPGTAGKQTDFQDMGLYDRLVNMMDQPIPAACPLKKLVVPGNPMMSLLYVKITGPPAACGVRMPKGKPMLSASDIALVKTWIMSGAPK